MSISMFTSLSPCLSRDYGVSTVDLDYDAVAKIPCTVAGVKRAIEELREPLSESSVDPSHQLNTTTS